MRYLALHIFLLIASFESFSQTMVWEKLIDFLPNQDIIVSVDQDTDTTFIFSGTNNKNSFFARAKLNGDTLWKKNKNVKTCYRGEHIASYGNNRFVHFGGKDMGNLCDSTHVLFQMFDGNGNLTASRDYGDDGVLNMLHSYALLPDGGFLASGIWHNGLNDRIALIKLDSSGNMLWYKKYRDFSDVSRVIINRKGNYLLSASSRDQMFAPAAYHPYFLEVNPNGDSINSKYLIVQADTVDEFMDNWTMLQNEDGDYVFTLRIDSVNIKGGTVLDRYAAIVMMDTLFNIKWKLYLNKGTGGLYNPSNVVELKDSTYVVIVANGRPESNQFLFYKISKTGALLDQKIFASTLCNKVYIYEIKLLSDSSMIVTWDCRDTQNAYIAKIDSVGLPACGNFKALFTAEQNGDSITFKNMSYSYGGSTGFATASQWKFSDSTTSATFNAKIQVTGIQDSVWAMLIATNLSGCTDTMQAKVKVNQVTPVLKPAVNNSIAVEVFPNPAKETITIKTPGTTNSKLTFYTSQGQLIKQQTISGQQVEIDLSSFPQGLYLYQVQNGEKSATGKFVKE